MASQSELEIEQIILGAILTNEGNFFDVEPIINPEVFADENHRIIAQAIWDLGMSGKAIKTQLVAGRMEALKGDADPNTVMSAMIHFAGTQTDIPMVEYARNVHLSWSKRKALDLLGKAQAALEKPGSDPLRISDYLSDQLSDISRDATIEYEHSLAGSVRDIVKTVGSGGKSVINPCLSGLEDMIGGFFPGDLILLGGGPGSFKTAFALQQALHCHQAGGLFELEMSHQKLVMRKVSAMTGISVKQMMQELTVTQLEKIVETEKILTDYPVTIVTPPKMDIRQLEARARALRRDDKLDYLIVDHIKLIGRASKYRMPDHERAYHNAFDLKALAKDLEIPVIALCQFTKSSRESDTPDPKMEDFFGGALEEHADVMLATLNRRAWLQAHPPTSKTGKASEDWHHHFANSENRIEIFKLKDRTGEGWQKKIFGLDAKSTTFFDLKDKQMDLIPGDDGEDLLF